MFGRFKRKNVNNSVRIPIDEQLVYLEKIGIKLKANVDMRDILDFEIPKYEECPYLRLLMSMGWEREGLRLQGSLYPSDDVWSFDRECIEDQGDYARKLKRLAEMLEPILSIADIADNLDPEAGAAWISFTANGKHYRHKLTLHDDWLSLEIFTIFSDLLAKNGSPKRFFYTDTGNEVVVVLIERDHFRRLNELIDVFVPLKQGE
ncbi:hypothetical protein ACFFSY_10140 [Paenibacillus aurantiacus]|uniref:Uncharacterized protein n=1 Tax=Paenibacillus aurantiacus TaxID=1936118 RepID=A0ABV5KQ75_9BACL